MRLSNTLHIICRLWMIFAAILCQAATDTGDNTPQAPTAPAAVSSQSTAYPVTLQGRTLFNVRERVYSLTPKERADLINERLRQMYDDPHASFATIHVVDDGAVSEIVEGDLVIMAVTDKDAQSAKVSRHSLAATYALAIRSTASQLAHDHSIRTITLGALWAVLTTVVLGALLYLVGRLSGHVRDGLHTWAGSKIRPMRIQRVTILSAERIAGLLNTLLRLVKVGTWFVLLYVYLSLVFGYFAWTRGWTAILIEFIMRPIRAVWVALTDFLPNLFFIAVFCVVSFYVVRAMHFIFREIGRGTIKLSWFHRDWADPTFKIFRFLVIAFTGVVVFPYLPGSSSPAFQGVSVFIGVLFSFGSSSAVGNVVAGIILTYTRAFQIGDRVQIGDTVGDIVARTLLITRVRTIKNVEVSIPNTMVMNSHIVNFSYSAKDRGLILHTSVTIGYDVPWRQVHALLLAAASRTDDVLADPKAFVLQTALDDFYVSYQLNVYTHRPAEMARIYSDLHQHIQDAFYEAGVEIMSPHYGALRDGNGVAIPSSYLSGAGEAAAFQVRAEVVRRPDAGAT